MGVGSYAAVNENVVWVRVLVMLSSAGYLRSLMCQR